MNKLVFLISIVAVLLLMATVMAADEGIPMILINKLDEIKTAIEGLTLTSEVNVYPNVTNEITVTSEYGIVISLKCGWSSGGSMDPCGPPPCPTGFSDLGTGDVVNANSGRNLAGYSERWCAK